MANTTQEKEKNTADSSGAEESTFSTEDNEESLKKEKNSEPEVGNENVHQQEQEQEHEQESENKQEQEHENEIEPEPEPEPEGEIDGEGEGEVDQELNEGELETEEVVPEGKTEKQLDDDQDRRNPQYIPKGGAFYEHDNRTSLEDVENKDPQEVEKKKKVWKESKESERWLHDWYKESEQQPKTRAEIIEIYGYDIRNEEAPPRARRRRKYGRGPDKYDRNWEDEQAYMVKQNIPGRRGKKKSGGRDEFPPLPNQNRKGDLNAEKPLAKSSNWKKIEDEGRRIQSFEKQQKGSSQSNRIEKVSQRSSQIQGNNYNSKKDSESLAKKINEEEIKSFRQNDKTKWKSNNYWRGKQEDIRSSKTKTVRQGKPQMHRSAESNKSFSGDSDVSHMTEKFEQMTFHNKHSNMRDNRQDSNEIEQEMDNPANRLNPKRYSKNRKGFTGFFPPEEIIEIDPAEIKQLHQEQQQKNQHMNLQQQQLNIQSVIRRYPRTYNGNPGYIAPRPIIPGIPQQGMSPQELQQALSPQGIPQQALSPQVPGLQPIELQQGPIPPQPNFVPPMYIDMDPHYGPSDMMGPYTGFTPFSTNQPSEMYQPSGGITYYNTECQNSNQIRPPPARRPKTAIPILPPPE